MRIPRNLTYVSAESMPWLDDISGISFERPIIDLKVERGEFSGNRNLEFTYNITKWDAENMQIQIKFAKTKDISQEDGAPEKLAIYFYGRVWFRDDAAVSVNGGPSKKKHNVPESNIPSQLPFQTAQEKAQKAVGKAGSSVAVIGNVLFNFALSASLNQLWSLINTQQIIITIPLFNMVLPDNAADFFGFLFPIAAFDIL
jgi:hypothetical protein